MQELDERSRRPIGREDIIQDLDKLVAWQRFQDDDIPGPGVRRMVGVRVLDQEPTDASPTDNCLDDLTVELPECFDMIENDQSTGKVDLQDLFRDVPGGAFKSDPYQQPRGLIARRVEKLA